MIDTRLFDKLNKVALAVSGGKDSMALLHDVARQFDHDFFYVINIEHGIRGEESIEDSNFVKEYCESHGIAIKMFSVDAVGYSREHGYTLEQGARLLRREIFLNEVTSGNADRVAVAHHMDDNVESVLMHIFRGSGIRGLKGMLADDGVLIRPLLGKTREDIEAYVDDANIPFKEDSTNSDNAYRRNFIRLDIMPKLRERYEGIDENIMRLSESAKADDEYLLELASRYITYNGDSASISVDAPAVLFTRCVYGAFKFLGVNADVEERHYSLLSELCTMRNGTTLDMPYGVKATMEYDKITLYRPREMDESIHDMTLGDCAINGYTMTVEMCDEAVFGQCDSGYKVLYADYDKLKDAIIRSRRDGDIFTKYKGGSKKLKDYLIDKRIPLKDRDMPIIARDNVALVIAGVEISNDVAIDELTSHIIRIKLRRKFDE